MSSKPSAAIVLAAGKGTRMKSDLPKVLHEVCGQPMLTWVLRAVREAGCRDVCLVLGPERDGFEAYLARESGLHIACQENRLGTGDAAASAAYCFAGATKASWAAGHCVAGGKIESDDVLICLGDTPAIEAATLNGFIEDCRQHDAGFGVLGMRLPDPTGYGRLVQTQDGALEAIVEHKDADDQTRQIDVCNTGIMFAKTKLLFELVAGLKNDNAQGEYYLTDCVAAARNAGERVVVTVSDKPEMFAGVNDRDQLAAMAALLQSRV